MDVLFTFVMMSANIVNDLADRGDGTVLLYVERVFLWAKIGENESASYFLFNCIENMAIKKTKDINEDG